MSKLTKLVLSIIVSSVIILGACDGAEVAKTAYNGATSIAPAAATQTGGVPKLP